MVFVMRWLRRRDNGFTIAELMIAASILFIVSVSIMGALGYASTANANTAKKENALEIANMHLEQARTMPYADLGTTDGYPTGTIASPEIEGDYTITTNVAWAVDPLTALSSCKAVSVTVSWTVPHAGSVTVDTNVAGKSAISSVGDVQFTVIDADTNKPVKGATVTIKPSVGPSSWLITNSEGKVRWGKIPQGALTVTGSCPGYALDTVALGTLNVTADRLNEWPISAVKPSTGIVTVTCNGSPLAGVDVQIVGPSGTLIQKSQSDGKATFTGLLKGNYTVTGSKVGYGQATGTPVLGVLTGGNTYSSTMAMTKKASLKVGVVDQDGNALDGATVTLSGAANLTGTTGADGHVQFTIDTVGSYNVNTSMTGYTSPSQVPVTVTANTDTDLSPDLILTKKNEGTLIVQFNFGSGDNNSYTVYLYNANVKDTVALQSFSMAKPGSNGGTATKTLTLAPGQYYVSRRSPYGAKNSNPVAAPFLNVGSTVTVTMTSGN